MLGDVTGIVNAKSREPCLCHADSYTTSPFLMETYYPLAWAIVAIHRIEHERVLSNDE